MKGLLDILKEILAVQFYQNFVFWGLMKLILNPCEIPRKFDQTLRSGIQIYRLK